MRDGHDANGSLSCISSHGESLSTFNAIKGNGNYKFLSPENQPGFSLPEAKCLLITEKRGVNEGDVIFKG